MFWLLGSRIRRNVSSHRRRDPLRRSRLESLERRDLLTAVVWSAGPDLLGPRTDAVAIVGPDDALRLLGGDAALPTDTLRLSTDGAGWTTDLKIDTQRNDLGAVRSGNSIFLFGGTDKDEGSDEALNYDYRFGDSQDIAKMDQVRYDFGYASDAVGRAYAIGGIGVLEDNEIWSQTERYDPSSDTWSPLAPLPQALHGMSAIGDQNGHIFVFGGSTTVGDSGIQNSSYSYDIASNTWASVAPMPVATRDSAAVMNDDGAIYLLGGMSSTGATDAVQVYDPATNIWTAQTALPEPVYSHAAAYDTLGQIIVAGGFDSADTPTAAVYRSQRLNIPGSAPVFTTSPTETGSLDTLYIFDVNAYGNPSPTYSLVTSPVGMTIDSISGLISWQPDSAQLGVNAVTVRASNVVGSVDQSFDVTVIGDTISPTAPADLIVSNTTETTASLSWNASDDANGVDRYDVFSVVHRRQRWRRWNEYTLAATVPADTTTVTITDLAPLTSTNYVVRAIDAAGNLSAYSLEATAVTLSAPNLTFRVGTQSTGTVQSPAKTPLTIQLTSRANPAATFSLVTGPETMQVDPLTGLAEWTPTVGDVGPLSVTFRATNSIGNAELAVSIDILADVPQLSVLYNPTTAGQRNALAGTLFTAQINDASNSLSTFAIVTAPTGMTINTSTGFITWTPTGNQGGNQSITVRGSNAAGTTDFTFDVQTLFTSAVTDVVVTDTTLLQPTASWIPPTGEGADLVTGYRIDGFATWGFGRRKRTHRVSYTTAASQTNVLLTDLVVGRSYRLSITALNAAGDLGLTNSETVFASRPALPQVRWSVNGFTGGLSVPGSVIAEHSVEIVLTDFRPDPSVMSLIDGPAGLTFDAATQTASWTPTAGDVTTGYSTTTVVFEATNSVGSVEVFVPIRVFFSGAVRNATTTRQGNNATARWQTPTDNVTPIVGYSITRHWTWSGRRRSVTWTVGNVNSIAFSLYPIGWVVHKGISVVPIDANGNLGVSSGLIAFGGPAVNQPPIAIDNIYNATENVVLSVDTAGGVLANDTDVNNDTLTASVVVQPENGSLLLSADGSFTYAPDTGFAGTDSFTYVASNSLIESLAANVSIIVSPVTETPAAPVNLQQIDAGPDSITLAWDLPTEGPDVDHYQLLRHSYVSLFQNYWAVIADNIVPAEVTLSPAVAGRYRIIAVDTAGNESPASNETKITRLADFNEDQQVDRADVAEMVRVFGRFGNLTWLDGDLDGDSRSSLHDLARVQSDFGFSESAPAAPAALLSAALSPQPPTDNGDAIVLDSDDTFRVSRMSSSKIRRSTLAKKGDMAVNQATQSTLRRVDTILASWPTRKKLRLLHFHRSATRVVRSVSGPDHA